MRQIIPSHIITRRTITYFQIAFLLVALGIFLGILGLALYAISGDNPDALTRLLRTIALFSGVIVGLVGIGFAIRAATIKPDNSLAIMVGNHIGGFLDDEFTYIRNLSRNGLGYIDAVLIGRPGVLIFRIVQQQGRFLNERGNWMKKNAQEQWRPLSFNPTKQAVDDIHAMRQYLAKHGQLEIPVFGVVVFVDDDPITHLTLKEPVVPATHMTSLHYRLKQNYLAKDRIDKRTIQDIVEILSD
jgi:hypothetical protein